jgi:hypothetical protein
MAHAKLVRNVTMSLGGGGVKQYIPSKYCCAWRGFEYCVVGRVNGKNSALVRNVTVSLGATEVAISISAVRNIVKMT